MPDLSDGVNWSQTDANNNQAPPNGWPEGMMPSGVNDAARADRGAMKRFWDKINPVQTITPSGGVYTFTTGNAAYPTAYVGGEVYCFRPGAPSGGNDLFQVNGLAAKAIWKHIAPGLFPGPTWTPILAGDIVESVAAQLVYDAAHDFFLLLNPQSPLSADGTGGGILSGSLLLNRDGGAVSPTLVYSIRTIGKPNEQPGWLNDTYGGPGSVIALRHASGSLAEPAPTVSNVALGTLAFCGWDKVGATDFTSSSVRIIARTTEAWSPIAHGGQLEIDSCNNGSTTFSTQLVVGPGLTVGAPSAPPGGMLIGDLNSQRLFCQGQSVAVIPPDGSSSITGNANVGGNLTVTGTSTLGSATVGGALNVTHGAGITGGEQVDVLTVTAGGSVFQHGLTVANSLVVTGGSSFDSIATNYLQCNGLTDLKGNVTCEGNLTVSNLTTTHGIVPNSDNTSSSGLSGQAWAQVATYWLNQQSDARLKSNIRHPEHGALEQVLGLNPVEFHWKATERDDMPRHRGFLAGDVRAVMGADFAGYSKENDVEGLAYNELTAVLWQAVQELAEEVEELRRQIHG